MNIHSPSRLTIPARTLALGTLGALLALAGCKQGQRNPTDPENLDPNGPGVSHVQRGEDLMDQGDRKRALEEFARAIALNPTLTDAHMGMADIYRLEGDYVKSESSYRRAAELSPQNFDAQYYHGLMLHLLDRVTDAVSAYLRALTVKPDDFQANLNISAAYYQLGENMQALAFGERAVKINPKSGPARVNLAAVFSDLGRHEEAVTEFQQSFELAEPKPRTLLGYAESLKSLGRFGEMRNTLEQLVKNSPSAAAYERLGYAHFKLEDYTKAFAAFDNALKQDPDYYPALNGIGVCELNRWYWSDKRDNTARERGMSALRKSLALNRNQAAIEELLGRYR